MARAQEFVFCGGRLAVDLALTGDVVPERAAYERLSKPDDMARWLAEGQLRLTGIAVSSADLTATKELRRAVWNLIDTQLAGQELAPLSVATVNGFAALPDLAPRLVDAGRLEIAAADTRGVLSAIARDAVHLFGDTQQLARLRECEAEDCRIVFFDDSRPGRRRWCSPQRCGDRLRARTYRARNRGPRVKALESDSHSGTVRRTQE